MPGSAWSDSPQREDGDLAPTPARHDACAGHGPTSIGRLAVQQRLQREDSGGPRPAAVRAGAAAQRQAAPAQRQAAPAQRQAAPAQRPEAPPQRPEAPPQRPAAAGLRPLNREPEVLLRMEAFPVPSRAGETEPGSAGAREAGAPERSTPRRPGSAARVAGREQSEPSATAAASPLDATLTVLRGPDAGRRYELRAGTEVIGRGPDCTIRLADGRTSRAHVSLAVGPEGVVVLDLGAKNGVYLGRARVLGPEVLRPGDELLLGATVLRYQDRQAAPRFRPRLVGPPDDPLPRIRDDVAFGILCAVAFTAGALAFALLG